MVHQYKWRREWEKEGEETVGPVRPVDRNRDNSRKNVSLGGMRGL